MTNQILVGLLAAAISGGLGYFLALRFWSTNYSSTNTSGDFGSPRGGFFAVLGGALISMMLFAYVGKYILPADTIGVALITSMIVGAIAGFTGMARGQRSRPKNGDSSDKK